MSLTSVARPRADIKARTLRQDRWWLQPLIIAVGFTAFVVYATWSAFNHPIVAGTTHRIYYAHPYLSPFYSPCFVKGCPPQADWAQLAGPQWISPALYILVFPLAFRATCYYYRKAYYRSFWLSPPACAFREPHKRYTGETRFPLIVQNIHRLFLYAAALQLVFVWWDVVAAFHFPTGWGLHVGTIVLLINACMLSLYTISCHSARHITGGHVDEFSKAPVRYRVWRVISRLNERHMLLAWISLFVVALTDLYVRLLAMGHIHDFKIF